MVRVGTHGQVRRDPWGRRVRRALAGAVPWVLLVLAVGDLLALRREAMQHDPALLAALFGLAAAAFAVRAAVVAAAVVRGGEVRRRAAAELVCILGVVLTVAAGTANWLQGLQGYAILHEGESVRLRRGAQLQAFEAGPLARLEEMDVVVTLDELALVAGDADRFDPTSHLRVWRSHEAFEALQVAPRRSASSGPLRFHQGAFGFAPRITIVRSGEVPEPVFDRVVPFVTRRQGPDGLSFHGEFDIADESLRVSGHVDLASLDEALRGHATLWLDVARSGVPLGGGALLPGHFADVDGGYRIGFTGLQRWSELVVSRRNYPGWMISGAVVAAVGGLLWPIAWWRSR